MESEDIFGNIVILAVGSIILIALLGGDPFALVELLPKIIIFALILALSVGFLREIAN